LQGQGLKKYSSRHMLYYQGISSRTKVLKKRPFIDKKDSLRQLVGPVAAKK